MRPVRRLAGGDGVQSRSRVRPVVIYCAVALIAVLGAGTWWLMSRVSPVAQDEASIDQQVPSNQAGAPVDGRLTTDMLELSEHDLAGRDHARFTKTVRSVERDYSVPASYRQRQSSTTPSMASS